LKQLSKSGKAFMPVESGVDGAAAPQFIRKATDATYLAVFNYKKQPDSVAINVDRLGLKAGKKYKLTEVLGGPNISLTQNANIAFTQESAYLYKITSD